MDVARVGLGQVDPHRMRVDRGCASNPLRRVDGVFEALLGFTILDQELECEHHIVGGEGFTVVPIHPFPQIDDHGPVVVLELVTTRKPRHELVFKEVEVEQWLKDVFIPGPQV